LENCDGYLSSLEKKEDQEESECVRQSEVKWTLISVSVLFLLFSKAKRTEKMSESGIFWLVWEESNDGWEFGGTYERGGSDWLEFRCWALWYGRRWHVLNNFASLRGIRAIAFTMHSKRSFPFERNSGSRIGMELATDRVIGRTTSPFRWPYWLGPFASKIIPIRDKLLPTMIERIPEHFGEGRSPA
jgi:hypothetical protein